VKENLKKILRHKHFWPVFGLLIFSIILFFVCDGCIFGKSISYKQGVGLVSEEKESVPKIPPLDKADYDLRLEKLANNPVLPVPEPKYDPVTGEQLSVPTPKPTLWPVKTIYPNDGAILPFNRIVAYYGNLYSTKMGVLGEYKEDIMLEKLKKEVDAWTLADPETPAIPALHYIAVVAQAGAGDDGKYRARMPNTEIDKVIAMAAKINALVFLDVQVGFSTIQIELPHLEKYLKMPNVHFGMDPEFSMKTGIRPGKIVGTYDAADINFAAEYLAKIVKENNLTPKILIVHRYTQKMVTNYKNIKPLPEVQIVMDMDGWGGKEKKKNTYQQFVYKEPVQFTGFKLFYKNDILEKGTTLFKPEEVLQISPKPIYIQYQ